MILNIYMNYILLFFYIFGVIIWGVDGFNDSYCEIIENLLLWYLFVNGNWYVMLCGLIGSWYFCVLIVLSCKWI